MSKLLSPFFIILFIGICNAQKTERIAFYNVENLFDTINDPNKYDEASPIMELKFDRSGVYNKKVKNMAHVISQIGADVSKNTPAIMILFITTRNLKTIKPFISIA